MAKKMGMEMYMKFTEGGNTALDWVKKMFEVSDLSQYISWEEFEKKAIQITQQVKENQRQDTQTEKEENGSEVERTVEETTKQEKWNRIKSILKADMYGSDSESEEMDTSQSTNITCTSQVETIKDQKD